MHRDLWLRQTNWKIFKAAISSVRKHDILYYWKEEVAGMQEQNSQQETICLYRRYKELIELSSFDRHKRKEDLRWKLHKRDPCSHHIRLLLVTPPSWESNYKFLIHGWRDHGDDWKLQVTRKQVRSIWLLWPETIIINYI